MDANEFLSKIKPDEKSKLKDLPRYQCAKIRLENGDDALVCRIDDERYRVIEVYPDIEFTVDDIDGGASAPAHEAEEEGETKEEVKEEKKEYRVFTAPEQKQKKEYRVFSSS